MRKRNRNRQLKGGNEGCLCCEWPRHTHARTHTHMAERVLVSTLVSAVCVYNLHTHTRTNALTHDLYRSPPGIWIASASGWLHGYTEASDPTSGQCSSWRCYLAWKTSASAATAGSARPCPRCGGASVTLQSSRIGSGATRRQQMPSHGWCTI